jgi:hypothetical protein
VSTTEELQGKKSSSSGLEIREYGRGDPSQWPSGTFYQQMLTLISPTSGGRSYPYIPQNTVQNISSPFKRKSNFNKSDFAEFQFQPEKDTNLT